MKLLSNTLIHIIRIRICEYVYSNLAVSVVNLILSFFLVFRFDKGNVLCGKTGYPETYNYNKFDASLIKVAYNRT